MKDDDQKPKKRSDNSKPEQVGLFDLESLRLSQDFVTDVGVKKLLTKVPIRRPHKQEFVRVHFNGSYYLETAVIVLKEDRETYLVDPGLWHELSGEIIRMALYTTINRQDTLFLWPIPLPGADGRLNPWHRSAFEAAERAKERWLKVVSNMDLGAYEVYQATGNIPDPKWLDDLGFEEILRIAFKDRFIDSMDHPVLRRLRGEV